MPSTRRRNTGPKWWPERKGTIKYRLSDGREFKSPSAAGTAITSKACNGWAFWSVDTGSAQTEPPETSEEHGEDSEDGENPEQTPAAGFRRVPNQKGIEEAQVRLYCDACQKSFTTQIDQQPETCPESHNVGETS